MKSAISRLFPKKFTVNNSEDYYQAQVLMLTHVFLVIMISIVLIISDMELNMTLLVWGILILSLLSIIFIRRGFLRTVALISYGGLGLLSASVVFTRPEYVNYEVYMVTTSQMFIVVISSLLSYQGLYTIFTTGMGALYIIALYVLRGLTLSGPNNRLEMDDYVVCMCLLLLTGYITRSTVTRRKRLLTISEMEFKRAAKKTVELEKILAEKEILIQEVHHRVKNNLNVAISILRLQAGNLPESDSAVEALQESVGRLHSMALVHQSIYESDDLLDIKIRPYITAILHNAIRTHNRHDVNFRIDVDHDSTIELSRAVPCGLILNELITNVIKHAYPNAEGGDAIISFKKSADDQLTLAVKDYGIGLIEEDWSKSKTLGVQLVSLLTEQLVGTLKISIEGGTQIKIDFPLLEP
ncbi:sensor histidine kinase [bacterium]|nr:sensor histidine kinase [bacterium]